MNIFIKDLCVKVKEKSVLNTLNLNIKSGEIHAIMGPNGAGKSTLSKVIMNHPDYEVVSGDIFVDDEKINHLSTDERARLGIFLAFQNPVSIEGVSNSEFLRSALNAKNNKPVNLYEFIKEVNISLDELSMPHQMMHRAINENFSGGERKKNEILQMKMLKPKFIILDELDSGLDVDSLKIVCENIIKYKEETKDVSILIITHYPKILEYLNPNYVHILNQGTVVKTGDFTLSKEIEKNGYKFMKTDTSLIGEE